MRESRESFVDLITIVESRERIPLVYNDNKSARRAIKYFVPENKSQIYCNINYNFPPPTLSSSFVPPAPHWRRRIVCSCTLRAQGGGGGEEQVDNVVVVSK